MDGPAPEMIQHSAGLRQISAQRFYGDPTKAKTVKSLGFRVRPYVDRMQLPAEIRKAISSYIAALLVRHPNYLAKLAAFHHDGAHRRKR